MQSVPREWLDFLRQQFPKDSRIQLSEIGGNPRPISTGSTGKLDYIDDATLRPVRLQTEAPHAALKETKEDSVKCREEGVLGVAQRIAQRVDIFPRGVARKAAAQSTVDHVRRQPDRLKNMAPPALFAGGAF